MRSKRLDASDGNPCRRKVWETLAGAKVAASSTMAVVSAETSVVSPPMTPAIPIGPESSVISRSSAVSVRRTPSRVVISSPSVASLTRIGPCSLAAS